MKAKNELRWVCFLGLFFIECFCLFVIGTTAPQWARASSFTRFLDHTQRRSTVGRTPLDEWSARRRDLYLTTHNTHNRQASMPLVGFEPTTPAGERPQTAQPPGPALHWVYQKKTNPLTAKNERNCVCRFSSYRAVNTFRFLYENY
jgi:hypothetical protein